jgi:glycerol-3-phosphate dehydrogenase
MSAERTRLVVIGGGVVGCAILWEFARRGLPGLLVEAEPDVCEGTSKATSAILHTGFDSKPGTVESRMLRRAAELWPGVIEQLGVPFLAVGALMLARTAEDADRLRTEVAANASVLGVATELLARDAVRGVAPYLAEDVAAALAIPGEGVLDPFWLTRAYAEAALAGGAEIRLGRPVVGLEVTDERVTVRLEGGAVIEAEQVVDAAGIRADEVARLAGDESFEITPRKGQFLVSEETFGVDRIILPIPGPLGKGMLVTPIVFGGLLLGPTAVDGFDKEDRSVDPAERARIMATCRTMVPAVDDMVPIRQFAGLRHVSSTGDFIVRPSSVGDRLYLAAGIRSTGISTSPAIAEAVVSDVLARRGWDRPARPRPLPAPAAELPEVPGEVVCLCRSICRGEVEAACRRPLAPATLDAVKRRCGAMFGDCQGNLCALEVAAIVARERGLPLEAVEKHRRGSWLWERVPGAAVGGAEALTLGQGAVLPPGQPRVQPTAWDVVVVGGGAAGLGAAEAASAAGLCVLVVERDQRPAPAPAPRGAGGNATARSATPGGSATPAEGATPAGGPAVEWLPGATVVGLSQADPGWLALAQTATGSLELRAQAVVVASGGYVEPFEHRPIAGPRPAGLMTADLAERLLAAGLRPGRRVALVGGGRRADRLAAALGAAGAQVERLERVPDEIRGEERLEAVRLAGDWLAADTLVLADRLLPQSFLLRGLGLLDGRPGTPPPVDAAGRLPLDGLWAAGCCVRPDPDHDECASRGRLVGEALAATLAAATGVAARGDGE